MTETERERQLLRSALAERHRASRRQTPPFELLWSRAVAGMRSPRRARRGLLALAAAAVVLVLAATVAWRILDRHSHRELERALTVAAGAGGWRAPLDFLLETPGRQWLEATPSWTPGPAREPWLPAADLVAPDSQSPIPRGPIPRGDS